MLNLIRNNVQSFSVKFIVGIVVIVMAFFGVSAFRNQSSNAIVTVDGYEIKIDKYRQALENEQRMIRDRYKNRAEEYMKMVNTKAVVVHRLTNTALLLKSAANNGLAVSDKELAHEIFTNPAFLTDDRFDEKKYETNLKNMRMEKPVYENTLREEILRQKYFKFIGAGTLLSKKAIEDEYRRYNTEFEVKTIEFDPDLFSKDAKVTDKVIAEYYDQHKDMFQQASQYAIKYMVLSVDDVKDKIIVQQKAIDRYYEKNKDTEFTNKASFLSRHILISTPQDKNTKEMEAASKKINRIYQQLLKNPKRFAALAKKSSDDSVSAKEGGDLGWVEKGTFVAEFEQVVDRLKKNEISKPFSTNFGYHIVELLDRKEEIVQPKEDVKEEITKTIRLNKSKRRLISKVKELMKNSAELKLDGIAKAEEKEVIETELFDNTKNLKDIGYSHQLYQTLKGKLVGNIGQYNLPGDQKIIVYEVSKVVEPFVKPLTEVEEQVRYYAGVEQKKKLAKAKLTTYAQNIKTLKEYNKLPRTLKTTSKTTKFKVLDQKIKDLNVGNNFKAELLKMEKGEIKAIYDSDKGYLVYMIDKIEGEIKEEDKENIQQLETMLRRQKAEVVLTGFINQLKQGIQVEYNASLLQALDIQLDS